MSSKGRKKQAANASEFFPTPREVVYSLVESDLVNLPGGVWIEPCAGSGQIISAVNERRDDINWIICELNEKHDASLRRVIDGRFGDFIGATDEILEYGDFVSRDWKIPKADVLIMNPPFTLTMQFLKAAFKRAEWVVCLQRQALFGSKERSSILSKHCPDVYQLPWRPSFRLDGKTDSCEYCWFVWPPSSFPRIRRSGKIAMLDMPQGQGELF